MKQLFISQKIPSVQPLEREERLYWGNRIGYCTFDKVTFFQCFSFKNLYRIFPLTGPIPNVKDPIHYYAPDGKIYSGRVWYANRETGLGVFRLESIFHTQSAQDFPGEPTIPSELRMKKGFHQYDTWLVSLQENEKCNFEYLVRGSCTAFDKYGRMVLTGTHSYRDGSIIFGLFPAAPSESKLYYLLGMITKIPDDRGVSIRCVARPEFLKKAVEAAQKAFDPIKTSTPLIPAELF